MQINLKKNIVIFVISILALIVFIAILNFIIYLCELNTKGTLSEYIDNYNSFLIRDISEKSTYYDLIKSKEFPSIENENSEKGGILLFGYSSFYSPELNNSGNFSYKFGQLTQRPIYNRSKSEWGVQHMLYQLSNEDFYKIVPKPEYIIYVYYDGHLSRMFTPIALPYSNCYSIFYKKTKKGFVPKKRTFFSDKIIIQHYLRNHLDWNILNKFKKYKLWQENLLADYIIESKNEAEKHWGKDIKFVVLCYSPIMNDPIYSKLQSNNILTIDKEDFKIDVNDKQYQSQDENPNEKAWDVIVPVIVQKLKLNE